VIIKVGQQIYCWFRTFECENGLRLIGWL